MKIVVTALATLLLLATRASAQAGFDTVQRETRSIFGSERIEIGAGGAVRILRQELGRMPRRARGQASPGQRAALSAALTLARFAELPSDPSANPPVGESLLTYTVRGGPHAHVVVVAKGGAGANQARLDPIDAAIDAVRDAVLGSPPPPPTRSVDGAVRVAAPGVVFLDAASQSWYLEGSLARQLEPLAGQQVKVEGRPAGTVPVAPPILRLEVTRLVSPPTTPTGPSPTAGLAGSVPQ